MNNIYNIESSIPCITFDVDFILNNIIDENQGNKIDFFFSSNFYQDNIIDNIIVDINENAKILFNTENNYEFISNINELLNAFNKDEKDNIGGYFKRALGDSSASRKGLYGAFDMGIERYGFLTPSIQMIFIVIYVISLFILITKIQNINRKYWPNLK